MMNNKNTAFYERKHKEKDIKSHFLQLHEKLTSTGPLINVIVPGLWIHSSTYVVFNQWHRWYKHLTISFILFAQMAAPAWKQQY